MVNNYFHQIGSGEVNYMAEQPKLRIVADENMPFVKEAFASFGEVVTAPGRAISRSQLTEADILLVRSVTRVDEELLHDTPVRFVASATIGIDHIDLGYLRDNSIGFAYAPGSNADSVAEYVLAALSVIARKTSMDLAGRTIGIIGVGNVGSRVFRHALTLGMKPLLCDPPKQRLTKCDLYRSLDEVLASADIVTIHVPLVTEGEEKTFHMVNDAFLDRMKSAAVLINTSRGSVVDEAAVLSRRKRIGSLVLDVWENEPSISGNLVAAADIATPHIAGYSYDGKVRGTQAIYEAACAWYFKNPVWTPPAAVFGGEVAVLDLTAKRENPVSGAILQAYAIEHDHERLKKILELPEGARTRYFDDLRKNYPKRSEFPHYSIKPGSCSEESVKVLGKLGFRI